jgi:hypothetical protein
MSQLSKQFLTLYFVFKCFVWLSQQTAIISLKSINLLIFEMMKCGVLFEVRTKILNTVLFRRA